MTPLLYGIAGATLVLIGAMGTRMLRETLVDDLVSQQEGVAKRARDTGPFVRLVDAVGAVTQRLLLDAYGRTRVASLRRQLRAAGQPEGLTAQVFIQREAGFISLGLLLFLLFSLNGQVLYGALLGVVFAGWMHTWLILTARNRVAQIERDLPDFLDVFAVTVAAGLPFRVAMQRVAEYHKGPLAEELSVSLREMQLGVPRRRALERMRERTRSENVATFVTALLQAEELGTPLAAALQDISSEIRRQRSQQVRQTAAKAQPKVSLVITSTIVPGAIVLIIGGMLINNLNSLRGLFSG